MTLQFGIIDYIIIAVFYALLATTLLLVWLWLRRWRYWRFVIVPIAAFGLILPWADEVWIAWHYAQLCEGAGVHVYKKVEVAGYYNATTTGWSKSETVTDERLIAEYEKAGFRFRERNTSVSGNAPGKISHLEKYPDNTWRITIIDRPIARYHYKFADPRQEVSAGFKIEKTEWLAVDTENGDVLGREVWFSRYPGWISVSWVKRFGGNRTTCRGPMPIPPAIRQPMLESTLHPIKKQTGSE